MNKRKIKYLPFTIVNDNHSNQFGFLSTSVYLSEEEWRNEIVLLKLLKFSNEIQYNCDNFHEMNSNECILSWNNYLFKQKITSKHRATILNTKINVLSGKISFSSKIN